MDVHLLGSVEAVHEGRPLALGAPKPRAVLAMLALRAGEAVSADQLVEGLWGDDPPPSARKLVQHYVSQLRRALGPAAAALTTAGRGYRLEVAGTAVDAVRFERLVADGRPREALALWHGAPLADVAEEPFAAPEARRLEELRLQALELAIEQDLEAGRHAVVVAELERLVAEHPLRERLHAQRMLALYRCGRQADALDAYRLARRTLVDEVGIEPGADLQRLHEAVLAQDPVLAPPLTDEAMAHRRGRDPTATPSPPAPAVGPAGGARRLVIAVAFAVTASAGEDPEVAHARRAELAARLGAVVGAHGGVLQDVATAVFGADAVRDDDAVRAVRSAAEAVQLAGVAAAGVDAGTAFVLDGTASGDVLAGAAGLAAAAAAGEVRIGPAALGLLRDEVRTAAVPGTDARRLTGTTAAPAAAPAPFVDREDELAALRAVVDDARVGAACRTVTVVGPPGIGKSRLVREFGRTVEGETTVLVGRCPGYGEGRTYRAMAEVLPGLDEAAGPEDMALAVRRRLERLAAERPVVVVIEDLHWAEPALLDLLEHLAAFVSGVPLVLAGTARAEFLEERPAWAVPGPGRSLVLLEGLPPEPAAALAAAAGAAPERQAGIVAAAEGNPLFLEQLVAVQHSDDDALPLTLQAVLAARIDRLAPGERAVLEAAAVVGRSFPVDLVGTLVDPGVPVTAALLGLVRRRLVAAERPERPGEDRCRFAHALIREAAYEAVPRRRRSDQHEAVAAWLVAGGAEPAAVGHHLALAHRHHLTPDDDRGRRLAREGARCLAAAAAAALDRGDPAAGARMLEEAVALVGAGSPAGAVLLPRLGAALLESGRLADARAALERAADHADERVRARAAVELGFVRLHSGAPAGLDAARAAAEQALAVLAAHGDELGQCRAWRLRAWVEWTAGRAAAADAAWQRAARHARRAGERRERYEVLGWSASAAAFGPMPVPEALRRCEAIRAEVADSPVAAAAVLRPLALLRAFAGDVATARELLQVANATLEDLGGLHAGVSHHEAQVELVAGRPGAAERRLRADLDRLEAVGEHALLATTAAMLAQAVLEQDRPDEADALCEVSRRLAEPDDRSTQALWRGVRARVRARSGRAAEAEALAREAVALVAGTDALTDQAEAYEALAEVLRRAGHHAAAGEAAAEARRRYQAKGAIAVLARFDRAPGAV